MARRILPLVVLWTVLSASVDAGVGELARASLVWADFDGDGLEDVYVVRPEGRDSLFRNVGDGSFEDLTAQALPCVPCASKEVAWRDVDQDRRPDLVRVLVSGGVELLRNRGDGAFDDVTLAAGLERVAVASAARWLDYDADGRPDLELVGESGSSLFHNLGGFLFQSIALDGVGATATSDALPVRILAGAVDEDEAEDDGAPRGEDARDRSTDAGPSSGRPTGGGTPALSGSVLDSISPDPLLPGAPPVDPLEPRTDGVDFLIPPFSNRCAWSVKDTSTGDCVLTSTLPTLGKLYPISANLFVSAAGDVGIGTTTPLAKLEVAGTARVTDTLSLKPSSDQALDVVTGSIYKAGARFIHTSGGIANTGLGRGALESVTTGSFNTANGYRALYYDTTGARNTASGDRALGYNTTGSYNSALGNRALFLNTTGDLNTASGYGALSANTIGDANTAAGNQALASNTSGNNNAAVGAHALFSNTTGNFNTASGSLALRFNTTGIRNTAVGYRALYANTTGDRNTASGDRTLVYNTSGSHNTANGDQSLYYNTTGSNNTASGYRSLQLNSTGYRNTADGVDALRFNTIGSRNTAGGARALESNTSGARNTGSGYRALSTNTSGGQNTANGALALQSNTTAPRNTASGYRALYSNTTGSANTASGYRALHNNTTGHRNIGIGNNGGANLTTGDENIAIGHVGFAGEVNTIRIGTAGTQTRAFVAGVRAVTTGVANAIPVLVDSAGQLGTVSSSRRFKKDIADMGDATERLLDLRPVVFHYEQEQTTADGSAVPLEYGLIAEEVAEILPDLVVYDEEGQPFTVKYHVLSSMLLNELKKVKRCLEEQGNRHARELEDLRSKVGSLESRGSLDTVPPTVPASDL